MKTPTTILTSILLLLAPVVRAQDFFSQGTNSLANTNLPAANADFAKVTAADPTYAEANVYYAMTRLLLLPSLPAGSSFLDQLGFSPAGRDVYEWTSRPATNSHGHLVIPPGLNADVLPAQLRNNVLAALIAAQTNLAQVTSSNFVLEMPQDVTHLPDVTIDYGDVLMLRTVLYTAELYTYGFYSLNFDAQITSVSNIIATDKSVEALLANFPKAFTFYSTNDKTLAQNAFVNAAQLYFAASDFIRNDRPPGMTFLFNLGAGEQKGELKFRQTLSNLLASVSGPAQPLPTATNISISMAALFSETNSPRQWLPQLQGQAFVWDSWTNVTLGGVVLGLTKTNLDQALLKLLNADLATPGVTLTVLSSFPNYGSPNGVIRARDGNLYGTTQYGGNYYNGTVFKVTPSGQMTTLYEFGSDTNLDQGAGDVNGVIQASDGNLYGTTQYGGANYRGTIFRISTSGTISTVYAFGTAAGDNGASPAAALVQGADGNLYGTTMSGNGTIFSFSPTSKVYKELYDLSGNDGSNPASPLIQGTDGDLYGVTQYGGTNAYGAVFEISTNGNNFTRLYSFGTMQDQFGDPLDGANPTGLVQGTNGNFYGATQFGGTNDTPSGGDGTLFSLSVSSQSVTLTTLFSFDQQKQDGFDPVGALVPAANGKFYGVTQNGGANHSGSIFAFDASGTARSVVWFSKATGASPGPSEGLTLGADGNFYGSTGNGGTKGNGTVYKLSSSQAPVLTTEPAGQTVEAGGGLTLQAAAAGPGTLTYQWLFDGKNVAGATTTGLTVKNVTIANAGSYEVIVRNSFGSTTSTVAAVTVLVPPSIPPTQPANQSVPLGGVATFSVKATGAPLTYLWLFDGAPLPDGGNISGSGTNQLTINPVASNNAGSYSVIVSNSSAAVTSKVAQLVLLVEKTKPSVTIIFPKANSRTNGPVLSGTASDLVRVASVKYWITNKNNGVTTTSPGLAALAPGKGSSNWTVLTALLPGSNILAVQSFNTAGLGSPVASAAFFYQAAAPFKLQISPASMGTVTGVASVKGDPSPSDGVSLYVGEGYTLTAKPAANWWLTNWMENSSIVGSNTTLTFVMESNLVVTANFATNLFLGMAGRYDGIFYPSAPLPATEADSGLIENLLLKTNGVYSGKLYLAAGTPYTLNGAFDRSGHVTETISRSASAGGNVTLQLDVLWQSVPRQITGSVQGSNAGGWISTNLNLFAATTNTNNYVSYTMLLPQDTNVAGAPPNYGYALVTNTGSMINMGGVLSDGSAFSRSEPINEQDQFPVYASLYNNTGLLLGQLSLDAAAFGAVPAGSVICWFKPPQHTGFYTNGFNAAFEVLGSPWTNSAAALAGLLPTNAQLTFSGGGLVSNLVSTVQLTSSNTLRRVGGAANFSGGTINRFNGLMTLTFTNTSGKKVTAYGTVLQNTNLGGGFFPGTTNTGTITLAP